MRQLSGVIQNRTPSDVADARGEAFFQPAFYSAEERVKRGIVEHPSQIGFRGEIIPKRKALEKPVEFGGDLLNVSVRDALSNRDAQVCQLNDVAVPRLFLALALRQEVVRIEIRLVH